MTTAPPWVLVVAGDAGGRLSLFCLLEQAGYHATVADDGLSALELLRSEPFDLVLLDLTTLDGDGFRVLRAVKSEPGLRNLPVIVLTAVDEPQAVVADGAGADGYLTKPVDPELLRVRVDAGLTASPLRQPEVERLDLLREIAPPGSPQ